MKKFLYLLLLLPLAFAATSCDDDDDKVPDVDAIKALSQSQIDALQKQLDDANAENARLKNMLANQKPASQSVKEYVTTPVSVFFNINKTNIASQKDLVNVQALANYAKDNNSKLLVTGYADSATGTPAINQKLSDGRANTVAEELVKPCRNKHKQCAAPPGRHTFFHVQRQVLFPVSVTFRGNKS